jgi:hypothetical protein
MNAWSGDLVPQQFLHGGTALERQGALLFQVKQCRNCHWLGEGGGAERSSSGQCRRASYAGLPGDPGRRKHVGVWEEFESGGDDRARRISRNVASGRTNSRSQRGA